MFWVEIFWDENMQPSNIFNQQKQVDKWHFIIDKDKNAGWIIKQYLTSESTNISSIPEKINQIIYCIFSDKLEVQSPANTESIVH